MQRYTTTVEAAGIRYRDIRYSEVTLMFHYFLSATTTLPGGPSGNLREGASEIEHLIDDESVYTCETLITIKKKSVAPINWGTGGRSPTKAQLTDSRRGV